MLIAIPSKGRAGRIRSQNVLTSAVLFVPASESQAYKELHPRHAVEAVPDSVRGITATRNWILDNTEHNRVVFVDDDVKQQGYVRLQPRKANNVKLNNEQWSEEFAKLFDVAEDLKFRVWGVSTEGATRSVYPYKPLLFRSYLTASCMGILARSGLRFDESFAVKEDYELGLRCIKEDGGFLAARYLYWVNEHWTTDGGCKDYRTQAMERDAIRKLQRKYPGMVRQIKRGGCDFSIEIVC